MQYLMTMCQPCSNADNFKLDLVAKENFTANTVVHVIPNKGKEGDQQQCTKKLRGKGNKETITTKRFVDNSDDL